MSVAMVSKREVHGYKDTKDKNTDKVFPLLLSHGHRTKLLNSTSFQNSSVLNYKKKIQKAVIIKENFT